MNKPEEVKLDYEEREVQEFTPSHEEPEIKVTSNTTSVDDYVAPGTRDDENDDFPEEIPILTKSSTTSSSSSTSSTESRLVAISLNDYRALQINYDRDSDAQMLVAVIGRAFDEPVHVANELQAVTPSEGERRTLVSMKFVPFTVRRSVLIKGYFVWQELKQYDLLCMCYNASEARLLLTGRDGFYTTLLRNIETFIGKQHSSTYYTYTGAYYVCVSICAVLQYYIYGKVGRKAVFVVDSVFLLF